MILNLRRKILNDFYRPNIKNEVEELQKRQWDSREIHNGRQLNNLGKILEHSRDVPYYKPYLSGVDISSDPIGALQNLPVLEKETIIDKKELFLHPNIVAKGVGSTSGSTGLSLSFVYDQSHLNNSEALVRFYRSWFGIDLSDKKLKIWGRPLKGIRSKLRSKISDFLRGVKTLDPWNISSENLKKNWEQLIRFDPDYIYGYATSIAALAKWINDCKLIDLAANLELKVIISTAETLLASDKQLIKKVFNCPVVEEYGAAEVSIIAHECPEGGFHIISDSLFLECVDDTGNNVPPGTPGHILVTSFANLAQPLLRYKIGDYGILLKENCSCGRGSPLLKLIGAKIIEMIQTESGKKFSAEIIDYINLALMKNSNIGIRQFRITQKDLRTFVIEIVPGTNFNETSKDIFSKFFKEQLGESELDLIFNVKKEIEPLQSGKRLYFTSEIT